jgi:hypothetical protein
MIVNFVKGWVDPSATVLLVVLSQLKNPMTSSGTKPATFRVVAPANYATAYICKKQTGTVNEWFAAQREGVLIGEEENEVAPIGPFGTNC